MSEHDSTELIPWLHRQIGTDTIPTVNGEDIHAFLGIGKDYSNWIKAQVKRAHLIENRDFAVYALKGVNPQGGRPSTEYHFTFDAAKHIGMLSRTPKGFEVREYFIEKEKELSALRKEPDSLVNLYPELRAIRELLITTAAARHAAEEAKAIAHTAELRAVRAETKADIALADVHRMTIEEFVVKNGLLRQFPEYTWRGAATWLGHFCREHGLKYPRVPAPGKSWPDEYTYPLQALMAWTRHASRIQGQDTFRIEEHGVRYEE
jgi:phage anti-repressor protein